MTKYWVVVDNNRIDYFNTLAPLTKDRQFENVKRDYAEKYAISTTGMKILRARTKDDLYA